MDYAPLIWYTSEYQRYLNTAMSAVRAEVNLNYKYFKQMWVSQYFARNPKVHQAPIYMLCKASAVL